ncbi:MAG: hypothetical protein KDA87_18775 [Planctomycetales bacterium]|nr:hypothetical protein [Planctomycetales bacterium]
MHDPHAVDVLGELEWVADDIEGRIRVKLAQEGIAEVDDLGAMIMQALAMDHRKFVPRRDDAHWRDSRTWSEFGGHMLALFDAGAFQKHPEIEKMFRRLPRINAPSSDKSEYWDEVVYHVVGPPDPMPDDAKWPEQRWLPNLFEVTAWLRNEALTLAGGFLLTARELAMATTEDGDEDEIEATAKQYTGSRGLLSDLPTHGTKKTGTRGAPPKLYMWLDVEKRLLERGDSKEAVANIRRQLIRGQNDAQNT